MKQFVARILFFIAGPVPTAEEYEAAARINGNVSFRNASVIGPGDRTEECDGVAGTVPDVYKKFPSADEATAAKVKAREIALKATGDKLAPSVGSSKPAAGTQPPVSAPEGSGEGQPPVDSQKPASTPPVAPAGGKPGARTPWGS